LSGAGGVADFFAAGLGGCAMADSVRASRHIKMVERRFILGFLPRFV